MRFAIRWIATSLAVVVAALLYSPRHEEWSGLAGVAFFVGFCNALARPLLLRWAADYIVPALILVIVAINVALLGGVNWLPELRVPSLGNGLVAALLVSLVSCAFSLFFRDHEGRVHLITHHPTLKTGTTPPEPARE